MRAVNFRASSSIHTHKNTDHIKWNHEELDISVGTIHATTIKCYNLHREKHIIKMVGMKMKSTN